MSEATSKRGVSGGEVFGWASVGIVALALVAGGIASATNIPAAFGVGAETISVTPDSSESPDETPTDDEITPSPDDVVSEPVDSDESILKNEPTDTVYYVTSGDTLTSISYDTGISVDRLAEYNSIRDVNVIYADSALRVPYILVPLVEDTPVASEGVTE